MPGSDFFEKVYAVVRHIPYGRVTSYGAVARFLGTPRSARMVGYAMNSSVEREDVPAHRVVNRNGLLTGKAHFGGSRVMEQLLQSEGIDVKDDAVVDFDRHFWDPSTELEREKFLQ